MRYLCPVCGYRELQEPPEDDTICPSCGTHFGYHDYSRDPEIRRRRWFELRQQWLACDAPWFSDYTPRPEGWDPNRQLIESGLALSTQGTRSEKVVDLMEGVDLVEAEIFA
jgi:hypothetical protein